MSNYASNSAEVISIIDYASSMLGSPVINVELSGNNYAYAFNTAIEDYSNYINNWAIRSHIANALGLPSSQDFTNRWVSQSFNFEQSFAKAYSQQAGVGGEVPFKKDFFTLSGGVQNYVITGDVTVNEVMWQETPAIMRYLIDPYADAHWTHTEFGWAYMGNSFLYITPIYYSIQAAQMAELRHRVRQSEYSYKTLPTRDDDGNPATQIVLYPPPGTDSNLIGGRVWYFYQDNSDLNRYASQSGGTFVNNPGTIRFDEIPYSAFNSNAQIWVKRYTLALCKEVLGRIRGKFSELAIPDAAVQMDADALLSEATNEKEKLVEWLMEQLEAMSVGELIKSDAENSKAIHETLSYNPGGIIVG
jgi:hypothetical protein